MIEIYGRVYSHNIAVLFLGAFAHESDRRRNVQPQLAYLKIILKNFFLPNSFASSDPISRNSIFIMEGCMEVTNEVNNYNTNKSPNNRITEKREYVRENASGYFRVYTSLSTCKYTVQVNDITKKGAFLHTKHLPRINETISFSIVDKNGMEKGLQNARVAWRKTEGNLNEIGFGIEFDRELDKDTLAIFNNKSHSINNNFQLQ